MWWLLLVITLRLTLAQHSCGPCLCYRDLGVLGCEDTNPRNLQIYLRQIPDPIWVRKLVLKNIGPVNIQLRRFGNLKYIYTEGTVVKNCMELNERGFVLDSPCYTKTTTSKAPPALTWPEIFRPPPHHFDQDPEDYDEEHYEYQEPSSAFSTTTFSTTSTETSSTIGTTTTPSTTTTATTTISTTTATSGPTSMPTKTPISNLPPAEEPELPLDDYEFYDLDHKQFELENTSYYYEEFLPLHNTSTVIQNTNWFHLNRREINVIISCLIALIVLTTIASTLMCVYCRRKTNRRMHEYELSEPNLINNKSFSEETLYAADSLNSCDEDNFDNFGKMLELRPPSRSSFLMKRLKKKK